MTRRVIFLNGPPRSGKDTIARGLITEYSPTRSTVVKFTEPMDNMVKAMLHMNEKEFQYHREEAKDKPLPHPFNHITMRQLLIKISEEWIKPTFGERYFGHAMVRKLQSLMSPLVIISDSGFYDEAVPVLSHMTMDRCMLVQVHRIGTSFEGDSRSYWEIDGLHTVRLNNVHDTKKDSDLFEAQMRKLLNDWLSDDN